MKVLVLKPGALGDGLLAGPMLARLREAWPAADLTWYGHAEAGRLLAAAGLVQCARPFDDVALLPLFAEPPRRPPGQSSFSGYDAALVYASVAAGGDLLAANLAAHGVPLVHRLDARPPAYQPATPFGPASSHVGEPTPGDGCPIWRWLTRQTAAALGWPETATAWPARLLVPAPRAVAWAEAWLAAHGLAGQDFVALHPGAGGAAKRWPPAGFGALGRAVSPLRAVVVGGPGEASLAAEIARGVPDAVTLVGEPLAHLAGVVAQAAAYVGHDSGPTHLAALLGVPVVAVFGPTDPALWRPWDERVTICRPGTWADGAWEWSAAPAPVVAALAGALGRAPA